MVASLRQLVRYLVVAVVLPCLAVGGLNANSTFNHFYTSGAFLLDSGWFSYVVYRQGLVLWNPRPLGVGNHFFSFHASLVCVASALVSHLVPLERVDWYCVFQGAVCAPLGAAVGLLVPPAVRPRGIGALLLVFLAALVFALNGEALTCMWYFHFEILIGAGVCIMLAGLATARLAVAYTGLAIAIAAREDGGVHAASFLIAVFVCQHRFPVGRRKLLQLLTIGVIASIVLIGLQRTMFSEGAPNLLEREYLGSPPYAHLSAGVLKTRVLRLFDHSLFVMLPFGLTLAIAAIDRDVRWTFGWLVAAPWAILNFLGVPEYKADFSNYFGFPFLPSMFWVGAYGIVKARQGAALVPLARLTAVALASTLGARISSGGLFLFGVEGMVAPSPVDTSAVRRFTRIIHDDPSLSGTWMMDGAVGSLGIDWFNRATALQVDERSDHAAYDGFAFFWPSFYAGNDLQIVVDGGFSECARLPNTAIRFCGRKGTAAPPEFRKTPLFLDLLMPRAGTREGEVPISPPTDREDLAFFGPLIPLQPGRYRASFEVQRRGCDGDIHVEAFRWASQESFAKGVIPAGANSLDLDFTVTPLPRRENSELRFYTGPCGYAIEAATVRALTPGRDVAP